MVKKNKLREIYISETKQNDPINKQDIFAPYEVPEGIIGEGDDAGHLLVSDSIFTDQFRNFNVTNDPMTTLFEEGIGFPGYPYLAQLSLRGEYRMVVETRAEEATRQWITIKSLDKFANYDERIAQINAEFSRLDVQGLLRKALCTEGYFGQSFLYIDLQTAQNDPEEKMSPLFLTPKKIKKGELKSIKLLDPTWVTPVNYDAMDPFSEDFYKPSLWWVLGQQIHASRMISMISQPVPDILKPAYNFGGVPLAFMCKPYVDNWLRTRQSVADLIKSFSTMILKTDLSQLLSPGCEELSKRAELMAAYRDNRGLQIVDKDSEDLENIATPLSGLDKLQAQSQEHLASISGIPLVKLLGITPSGLNASSDGEIRCFYDKISALQQSVLRQPIEMILKVVQLHLFGLVDKNITFEFNSLWQLDEVQQSQVDVNTAKILAEYLGIGAIDTKQIKEIISHKNF